MSNSAKTPSVQRWAAYVAVASFLLLPSGRAFADPPEQAAALAEVQGRWVRKQTTPEGLITVVKEHAGTKTTLTATNAAGKVLYAHTSEFTLDVSGQVRVFTYFNRVALTGADQADPTPSSYIYRIHNNRFIEIRGLLIDEPNPPGVVVWDRAPDNKKPDNKE